MTQETTSKTSSPDDQTDANKEKKDSVSKADDASERQDALSQIEEDEGDEIRSVDADNVELSEDAKALKDELDKIIVTAPTEPEVPKEEFDPAEFSESYKENLPKEKLVLAYAENFRRQYVHLYRDRKPLFLNPVNECGVEKFVCTTIRPTQLPFQELYDWDGAAEFVADYLNFELLDPSFEQPKRLLSPTTILKRQKGNCFEYSTLLCSFLIGAGYDAYVVSGYASRETCLMDETREVCPLLKKKVEVKQEEKKKPQKKYTVKPPKDLRSRFELKMEERQQQAAAAEEAKIKAEEEARIAELEKPPPDDLHGLRIHAWVLVLEGKREVPESFFIEPFTGISHSVNSPNYLGIETIWNHQNYWVNMQDCSEGVKNMKYDLGDCTMWEFMFPSNEKPQLTLPDDDDIIDGMEDEDGKNVQKQVEEEEVEKHLDMPPSWVQPIIMDQKDFQMRCPQGKKLKLYKRAKLEKYAPYLMKDGLTSKLSVYADRECMTDLTQVKEFFQNRSDKLQERIFNHRTGWVTENYAKGRSRSLKEHQYRTGAPGPENDRTMIFYNEARVDGLVKRVESSTSMEEHFKDRNDFLFYRNVEFGKRPKKFGPAENNTSRPILKMLEKYHRNDSKSANDDIAELVFLVSEEKIQITYHTEKDKISSSTREFIKPANSEEKGATVVMTSDMHSTFQVDPRDHQKKQVDLYQMLVDFIAAEDRCREKVRESEEEVREILNDRTKEEVASELDISVYDTMRNEKAKKHRKELERLQLEEKMRRQEMELDYLAPFLAQIGDPEKITRQQAYKLKEDCLADLKARLIDKANLIQARFEKETQELQKKQAWYQQNQVSMQKDDEDEYLDYCSEAMFRIHILEYRLNRHKEMAPHKYMALEHKLRTDQRLAEYF